MFLKLLNAKIHRATVTQTDANYHGSITIDRDLLDASGLLVNECVLVADCENGNRFETYIIPGQRGTGIIGINGAAARLSQVGNHVIIMSFLSATPAEAATHAAKVVLVDDDNRPSKVISQPSQGQ